MSNHWFVAGEARRVGSAGVPRLPPRQLQLREPGAAGDPLSKGEALSAVPDLPPGSHLAAGEAGVARGAGAGRDPAWSGARASAESVKKRRGSAVSTQWLAARSF